MKKRIALFGVLGAVLCGNAGATALPPQTDIPTCIQDQYGNQYDKLAFDVARRIITGIAHNRQSCDKDWPMIGSWDVDPDGKIIMELSVANPSPSSGCTEMYKLKGVYPEAAWNYTSGYGSQEFKYAPCSSKPPILKKALEKGSGGARGVK